MRKLNPDDKSPILCFIGPPGVGKTSLGQTIARATDRKFVRLSLGGVHDESEIRGHHRTYIGALPGNVIQSIHKAGTRNPAVMLDEMDKLGAGFHGDPSAAPCWRFSTPSKMQLSATTTSPCHSISRRSCSSARPMWSTIFHPPCATGRKSSRCPATSRMRSWQSQKRYLVRRQLASAGLTEEQYKINEGVLLAIIRDYTREAGVRNLERQIGAICRHVAMRVAEGSATRVDIAVTDLQVILGSKRFEQEIAMRTSVPGVATGLAWAPAGGDILFVEATSIPGRGKLILTGQLAM